MTDGTSSLADAVTRSGLTIVCRDVDTTTLAFPDVTTSPRRPPWPLVLLAGLAGGLAWGVVARVWMRFISEDPEFSWSGTLVIFIAFGLVGLLQAVAFVVRRAGCRRPAVTAARAVGAVGLLPIFGGAGGIMAPTVVLGGLAWARHDWSRWARGALAVLASVVPIVVAASLVSAFGWSLRAVVGTLWMLVIYGVVIVAASATFAPLDDGWRLSRTAKVAIVLVPVALVGAIRLALAGLG